MGKQLHDFCEHCFDIGWIESGVVSIEAIYLKAESGGEVFFISKHHVYQRRQTPVRLASFGFPANRFPQRRAVVQVVGNDDPGPLRRFHRFLSDQWRSFRERAKDAARVKPASSILEEDLLPIYFAGFQL